MTTTEECFNYSSHKDALAVWGELLLQAEKKHSNVKKKTFAKSSSNCSFKVLSSGIYVQPRVRRDEKGNLRDRQNFCDGYRDLVGRVCVGSFDDGTFIYTDGTIDKGVQTTLIQVVIKTETQKVTVSYPADQPLKRIGLNAFDIAKSVGKRLVVNRNNKNDLTPDDAMLVNHGGNPNDMFALTQKHGYSHIYLSSFYDGLQDFRHGSTSACTPYHEEGRQGYEDGKRIREIIDATEAGERLTEKARAPIPRFEFFPAHWIKPGEYSYCGRCGQGRTLREGDWKSRPVCPFCSKTAMGFIIDHVDETTPVLSRWAFQLRHMYLYCFKTRYKKAFNEAQAVKREQKEQQALADELKLKRIYVAEERRAVLQLPPLFWEVNLDSDRHCNRCGHVDPSNVLWCANRLYFAFCKECLKDERGCWKVVRNETARIKKEKESRKRR